MRLSDFIVEASTNFPNKVGIYSQSSSYTYKKIYELSNRLAIQLLSEYNLKGNNIIIHACNSCEYCIVMSALLTINCTIIPVSVVCGTQELQYIINESRPTLILVDEYTYKKYGGIYANNNIIIVFIEHLIEITEHSNITDTKIPMHFNEENEIAFIIYSSGSTGELKGVKCNHKAIIFAIKAINESIGNKSEDKVLCALPFSFDYGLYQIFLVMDVCATAYIHTQIINILQLPHLIKSNEITGFPALPMWLNILVEKNRIDSSKLSSLRYITSTGDTLKVSIIDKLSEKLPHVEILCMYGLTECKRVSILQWKDYQMHKGSVGLPLRGTSIRIVDKEGNDVPLGEIGELVVRGPHLMAGYFNDDELTKNKYKYNRSFNEKELYTGDLFKMDQYGYLYFVSRTQFFIKRRGQRISPLFIENNINQIAGVIDSVVVPVRVYGKEWVIGFVRVEDKGTFEQIVEKMKKTLPDIYRLDYVILFPDIFPYNSNGKIDRKVLIKIAKNQILKLVTFETVGKNMFTILEEGRI